MRKIVFLGPHFDDCVLSCGELIDKFADQGDDVCAITFFTGYPDEKDLSEAAKQFHSNCFLDHKSMDFRSNEDITALNWLNCKHKHLGYYECLYRKNDKDEFLYPNLKEIYHLEHKDKELIKDISKRIEVEVADADVIFAPMGLGLHADHIILHRAAVMALKKIKKPIYFYEEVPYVCYYYKSRKKSNWGKNMESSLIKVSDKNWQRKLNAIKFYRSQLHILWRNEIQRLKQLEDLTYKYSPEHAIRVWSFRGIKDDFKWQGYKHSSIK